MSAVTPRGASHALRIHVREDRGSVQAGVDAQQQVVECAKKQRNVGPSAAPRQ